MISNYLSLIKMKYYICSMITISLFQAAQTQLIRSVEYSVKENLKYVTSPSDSSLSLFEMKKSLSVIHIDFGRKQDQVIVVRNEKSVKLKLAFQVHAPLTDIYQTLSHEFCFQINVSANAKCLSIPNVNKSVIWLTINFTVRWLENKSGFKLTINFPSRTDNDFSGFYFLKSSSSISGMVLSNYLEIRDVLYWDKNIISHSPEAVKETYNQPIVPSDIPKLFTCSDQLSTHNAEKSKYWIPIEFKSLVQWVWCPVSKQTKPMMESKKSYVSDCLKNTFTWCKKPYFLCPILSGKMPGWKEIISFEGSIALTSAQYFNNHGNQLDGYALMCYYESKKTIKPLKYIAYSYDLPLNEFTKGLQWDPKINERLYFTLHSPINQTMEVGILKIGFILTAFYHGPSHYTYEWIRHGKKLFNTQSWIIQPYSLEYKSTITFDMGGSYYLRIKSSTETMEFQFIVKVLTPPILVNVSPVPILSTVYLMVNSNFSIAYSYKGYPTFANIYINGILYKPTVSDRKIFLNDLGRKAFNLKHLDFYFVENKLPNDITEYTYRVKNVSFPETLLRGQDHNVIIEVGNQFGVSRSTINIYVLKPPKFESLPESDNCTTSCSSFQPHLFRCELNTNYYLNRGVLVEKFWFVNDIRLDSLPYYKLYFKNDPKGLNLSPLYSNFSDSDIAIKVLLKKANLTCRVRLLYPESINMSDTILIHEKRIIYDTFHDPRVLSNLSAAIRIDWEIKIAAASYTWIIFLSIVLILIIMFIFLLVKFTLRGQRKSYQIEKLELAKGYNRDEEIIENETIKPYLRSANNTILRTNYVDKDNSKGLVSPSLSYSHNGNGSFRPRDVLDIMDDGENTIDPKYKSWNK